MPVPGGGAKERAKRMAAKTRACTTCNGEGLVGGLTPNNGYENAGCPECNPDNIQRLG